MKPLPLHIAVIRPDLAAEGAALVELIRRMDADDVRFGRCRVCNDPIGSCELCRKCAKGNDPFPHSGWWSDLNAR